MRPHFGCHFELRHNVHAHHSGSFKVNQTMQLGFESTEIYYFGEGMNSKLFLNIIMLITYAIPFFSEKDKHQNQNETGNFDKSWNHCKPRPTTMTAQVSKKGLIRHFKKEETGRVDFRKDFWVYLGQRRTGQ